MKYFVALALLSLNLHAKQLSVMQYNAENFFDTIHDEGKQDWTYLPLHVKNALPEHSKNCKELSTDFYVRECLNLDWNEARFSKKLQNVAKVIKSFDATNKGPDIVVLQEIENANVINKIVTKGLDKLGYRATALIEGDDERGIDVGVISKYPIAKALRHPLIMNGKKINTRGILEVHIDVNGKDVVVFANHWPSQSNPTQERIASAQILAARAKAANADLVIALGDFNTLSTERPSPFDSLKDFIDADPEARRYLPNLNPGTHFYKGEWSSLDHIFILKSSSIKADFKTFQIMNRPFMLKRDQRSGQMIPNRFNFETAEGFSDHLPLSINFNI